MLSPIALKSLAGLGAVATLSTTGLILHQKGFFDAKPPIAQATKTIQEEFKELKIQNCNLPTSSNPTNCTNLNKSHIQKIFEKYSDKKLISVNPEDSIASLKIEKIGNDYDYRFIFTPTQDITLKTSDKDSDPIILKANTTAEFRFTNSQQTNWYLLEELLVSDIIKKIEGLSDKCKNTINNSCSLKETELKALNIFSEKDEKWTNLIVEESTTEEKDIVSLSWEKSKLSPKYFSSPFKFTIKSLDSGKTLKIKKDASDDEGISITNQGADFWLKKETTQSSENKYYLAKELSQSQKETKSGITCASKDTGGETCCKSIDASKIQGLTSTTGIKITKTQNAPWKYTVSNSSTENENGEYEIDYSNDTWTLKKIQQTK